MQLSSLCMRAQTFCLHELCIWRLSLCALLSMCIRAIWVDNVLWGGKAMLTPPSWPIADRRACLRRESRVGTAFYREAWKVSRARKTILSTTSSGVGSRVCVFTCWCALYNFPWACPVFHTLLLVLVLVLVLLLLLRCEHIRPEKRCLCETTAERWPRSRKWEGHTDRGLGGREEEFKYDNHALDLNLTQQILHRPVFGYFLESYHDFEPARTKAIVFSWTVVSCIEQLISM